MTVYFNSLKRFLSDPMSSPAAPRTVDGGPLAPPILCLVTDRTLLPGNSFEPFALVDLAAAAARAGVDLIQVREPDLDDRTLCRLVAKIVAVTTDTPARVLVNDRPDVACSAGAAGVHLKASSCPAVRVRALARPGWLIGRSVHGAAEARRATAAGAIDYLVVGTIFATDSKPGQSPAGLEVLQKTVKRVQVPVLAIGGITPATAAAVGRSGAAGMAAVGVFARAANESAAAWARLVDDLRQEFDEGRRR